MIKPPDYVSAIKPYIPGKPVEELERDLGISDSIKLASNENPTQVPRRVRSRLYTKNWRSRRAQTASTAILTEADIILRKRFQRNSR